ncbi:hypothetical protein [Streptomyces noursei]|uniref:Lipoprotein n=1 Tax=Streptomyces noursei TaxID=1971 RepID=A0A2N8PG20_STRNR|nr:hypothetical protein [Streptomyces noursei]PNE39969.1 hypothetical protein AOB60_02585 [Streptomyces noursei]
MVNVRHGIAAALVTGVTLLAVSCTGGGAGSGKDNGVQHSDVSGKGAKVDDAYAYRQCLREHGAKVDEPKDGQAMGIQGDDKSIKKAMDACKDLPGAGKEMTQEEQEKALDQAVKFAKCMREHGVDMPDPEMRDGKLSMRAGGGPDVPKEKMEKAQKACNDNGQ